MKDIVREESPLRRLPVNLNPKQAILLNAIRLTAEGIDVAYRRLRDMLGGLGTAAQLPRGAMAAATTDAWAIIDQVWRLRSLVQRLPGYRGKSPSKQIFLRATSRVEGLRHAIQHLDTDVERLLATGLPVLGSVTWLQPGEAPGHFVVGSITPGQLGAGATGASVAAPLEPLVGVTQVELWAAGGRVNLTELRDRVAALVEALESIAIDGAGEPAPIDLLLKLGAHFEDGLEAPERAG